MRRRSLLPILFSLVSLKANACFCFSQPMCSEEPDRSGNTVVFTGTALRVETGSGMEMRRVRFAVGEWLEGVRSREIDVFTSTSSCGYRFEKGKMYLVVARRTDDKSRIETGACSRTTTIDSFEARQDLITLRAWRDGVIPAPRVFGEIFNQRQRERSLEAVTSALVRLTSPLFRWEVRSDANGGFAFESLPLTTYRLEIDIPGIHGSARVLDFSNGGCFEGTSVIEAIDGGGSEYTILPGP